MFKSWLIKMLMPSADQMADMAVDTVAKFINESNKTELIAKYGTYADEFTKVQAKVTAYLRDGKIDEQEKQELHNALLPLAQKLVEEIKR